MTELEQHVFTETAKHLIDQGHCSKGPEGWCTYKDNRGNSCAVGRWISMRDYRHSFEASDPRDLRPGMCSHMEPSEFLSSIREAIAAGMGCAVDEIPWNLLDELQHIHDSIPPVNWFAALKTLATKSGLQWPEELPA